MCGGGGGGSGGNDQTYYSNQENDRRQQEINRARDMEISNAQATDVARNRFNTERADALTGARSMGTTYFQQRGLPVDEGLMNSVLGGIAGQIPDLDTNPGKYFNDQAFGAGVDRAQNASRTKYIGSVNSQFAPGFERSLIPDNSIDPIISSILGEQSRTAHQALDFNKARGLLNDTGYNTSLGVLGNQENAGRSTLMDLANSVLGKDRQQLMDIRGEAGDAASNWQWGQGAPDVGGYFGRAQSKAGQLMAGLEGSVRGAVGGTNFFDVPTALQKGGTMQGPISLQPTNATPVPGDERKTDKGRGLGSTGVF